MKNRTVIGIICMVLAVTVMFVVAPAVNRMTEDTSEVLRLSQNVRQGTEITESQLETAVVKSDTIPMGTLTDADAILGKFAASDLYAGDYLTNAKLSDEANTADDVFASLTGEKVAISVTIDTFAAGLSGKLNNGDIISVIVVDEDTGKAAIPGELKYMKVITTTTAGGIDQDEVTGNEDGSYELPSTITVLANTIQAKKLAEYEDSGALSVALVYRGTPENAAKFLAAQDEFFESYTEETQEPEKEEAKAEETKAEEKTTTTGGKKNG